MIAISLTHHYTALVPGLWRFQLVGLDHHSPAFLASDVLNDTHFIKSVIGCCEILLCPHHWVGLGNLWCRVRYTNFSNKVSKSSFFNSQYWQKLPTNFKHMRSRNKNLLKILYYNHHNSIVYKSLVSNL